VVLPARKSVRIPSPDGRWVLIGSPFSLSGQQTLTLVDRTTGRQTVVKHYDRSIDVAWNPDSASFFLNDAYGSNVEDAYLYPTQGEPLELDDLILNQDPDARRVPADHMYFHVGRWLSAKTMLVEYCGHNSASPAEQFDFLYRIDLNGLDPHGASVRRIFHRVRPLRLSGECRL